MLGSQLYPSDYPWNQNIASAPVAANSASIIAHIGSSVTIHPDWGADSATNSPSPLYGIPYNVVHGNSTAKINATIDNYPGESDIVAVPIPSNAVIEGDYQSGPNPNGGGYNTGQRGDSHLIVWDEDNNIGYELYGTTRPADPTLFPDTNGNEHPHTDGKFAHRFDLAGRQPFASRRPVAPGKHDGRQCCDKFHAPRIADCCPGHAAVWPDPRGCRQCHVCHRRLRLGERNQWHQPHLGSE
jgi:hypothetical protein